MKLAHTHCNQVSEIFTFSAYRPKFRSYKPQDEMLQEAKLEEAQPTLVEDEVKDLLEAGKEKVGIYTILFDIYKIL